MPGDTIQMKAGRLYINGTMVEREEIGTGTDTDSYGQTVPVTLYQRNPAQRRHPHHPGNLRRRPARQHRRICRARRPLLHDGRQPRPLGR